MEEKQEEELMLTPVKWDLYSLHKHFYDMNNHANV